MDSPTEIWLSQDDIGDVPTSDYWNEEANEETKAWSLKGPDDRRVLDYISTETNLLGSFESGLAAMEAWLGKSLEGVCLDLGAGVCWTSGILARRPGVTKVYAVELSRHRLFRLAPIVLAQLDAPAHKVTRALGDFTKTPLPAESVDVVVMAQAYHHASEPEQLLQEVHRVLKPGGALIVVGERPITRLGWLRTFIVRNARSVIGMLRLHGLAGLLLGQKLTRGPSRFLLRFSDLFPIDRNKGDHPYPLWSIAPMFGAAGLTVRRQRVRAAAGQRAAATVNILARKL